jgi:tRNA (adenine22-N1)-methyltransferase
MISQRLLTVASFIKETDNIIDIGCDHGYLGIILTEKKMCHNLLLTDVKDTALNNAKKNIKTQFKINMVWNIFLNLMNLKENIKILFKINIMD